MSTIVGIGTVTVLSNSFTRPANTTAYASGQLVANNTTAASVIPLTWTSATGPTGAASVARTRVKKSGTGVTNASFRLHLYSSDPSSSSGITNGDGGNWVTKQAGYCGSIDVTVDKVFSDGAAGTGDAANSNGISFQFTAGKTVYGLLEARGAYTPVSGEVFTVELEAVLI